MRLPMDLEFGTLLVPAGSARRALIGTAFDYLLRFRLKREFPDCIDHDWVAERGLRILQRDCQDSAAIAASIRQSWITAAEKLLARSKDAYHSYLISGEATLDLLLSTFHLAQIDSFVRSRKAVREFGLVYDRDVKELQRLYDIIPMEDLIPSRYCLLNPTFGKASIAVGGADADLLIDDVLVEIKTTEHPRVQESYFMQLVAYFILSENGGIDQAPPFAKVAQLGIYSSRHGQVLRFPVGDIVTEKGQKALIDFIRNLSESSCHGRR